MATKAGKWVSASTGDGREGDSNKGSSRKERRHLELSLRPGYPRRGATPILPKAQPALSESTAVLGHHHSH